MNRAHQAQTPLRYGPRYATSDAKPPRACPMCGSPLTSQRARFCSAACKQLAYRLRHLPAAVSDLTELRQDLQHRRVCRTGENEQPFRGKPNSDFGRSRTPISEEAER